MSSTIDRQQLEALLAEHPPEEVFRRHGESFDDECRALWQEFTAFDKELQALSGNLARLAPPAPAPARPLPAAPRPWWQRRISIPAWSLPLAATAAALVLTILSVPQVREHDNLEIPLSIRRGMPFDSNRQALATNLYDALMEYGVYLYKPDDPESYRTALFYLEQAFSLRPDDDRPLNFMEIIAETLKDRKRIKRYQTMRQEFQTLKRQ